MREQISLLMDGELDNDASAQLVSRMKEQDDWHLYHLIGDAIRDKAGFRADLDLDFSQAIDLEPTVLAPQSPRRAPRAKWYALSAAASFAAVMAVGWVAMQGSQYSQGPKEVAQARLNIIKSRLDDYLAAHQEISPESGALMTSNIRTVSDTYQENGR